MFTVLITGANKGIGRGFVKKYLARPYTTVVATVRDTSLPEVQALSAFPRGDGSKILFLKLHSHSETDALEGVRSLTTQHDIDKLDIVIANSGIFKAAAHQKISQMKIEDLMEHFDINTASVVRLFQATLPLQEKAINPIFLVNSAGAATIAGMDNFAHFPLNSYAASKAAVNFLTRRIHFENPKLIAFAVHPGQVVTETRTAVAKSLGASEEGISVEECVDSLVALLDSATRDETSGKFLNYDGAPLPW